MKQPPESADVVQFPEEAITDWTKPRPIPDKNFIPMRADQYRDVFGKSPDLKKVKKTEAQIKSQIEKQNKKNIKKMKDRKEFSYKENLLKEIDNKIIKPASYTIIGEYPTDYIYLKTFTSGKSYSQAANKAIESIDIIRGIWNLFYNRGQFRYSSGKKVPVNTVTLFRFDHICGATVRGLGLYI